MRCPVCDWDVPNPCFTLDLKPLVRAPKNCAYICVENGRAFRKEPAFDESMLNFVSAKKVLIADEVAQKAHLLPIN